MTTDYDDLCKRLRNISEPRRICIEGEAADAIKQLEADNAALRKALQGIAEDTNTDDDTADYLRYLAKLALKDAALLAGKKP